MPLSPLAVFQPSAAGDSSATNQRHEQTVPAGAVAHAHAHAPQQTQPPTSTTAAVSVHSIGSINARMHAMAGPGAQMDPAQRKAEVNGCKAEIHLFLERYYQQLEEDLLGFTGLKLSDAVCITARSELVAAAAAAANGLAPGSASRTMHDTLNLPQHQASAIPPPPPLRDYTGGADGQPINARSQSSTSVTAAFGALQVTRESASAGDRAAAAAGGAGRSRVVVKKEPGTMTDSSDASSDEEDAEEKEFAPSPSSDSSAGEEDDEEYSEGASHSKSKSKKKKAGVLSSMFSSSRSKSGRTVRRRRVKQEDDGEEEDPEEGEEYEDDDDDADEGRGSRHRKGNRGASSSSADSKARRSKLPLQTTNTLRAWALAHVHHPFPCDAEKRELALMCRLNFKQVSDWFTNNRKRFWKPFSDHLIALPCTLGDDAYGVCMCDLPASAVAASSASAPKKAKKDGRIDRAKSSAALSWELLKAKYDWQEACAQAARTGGEKPPPLRVPAEIVTLEEEFKRQHGRMPTHMWVQMWD